MTPGLIFPVGAAASEIFLLKDSVSFSIGRSKENQLQIPDIDVSRRHCAVTAEDGKFLLKDLKSRHGTYVNGAAITETGLKHGDSIRLGNSLILFLTEDETAVFLNQDFQFDNGTLATRSEILFEIDGEEELQKMPPDINALAKFGQALNEMKDAQSLQNRFLEIILKIIPAEHGAILLFENDLEKPSSVSVLSPNRTEKMTISRTVSRRILSERTALLSNDLSDEDLKKAESLMATRIKSLLCVPLRIGGAAGLIYLDSSNVESGFTENHLHQLTAISFLISAALERQFSIENLERENARLQTELEIETNLIGVSDQINKVFQLIIKVSPSNSNILITGESGTGKELAAQSIYRNSRRREKPFVTINCAVLSENLLESDLFGHEKGAFTGAIAQKKGKLEIADGDTVYSRRNRRTRTAAASPSAARFAGARIRARRRQPDDKNGCQIDCRDQSKSGGRSQKRDFPRRPFFSPECRWAKYAAAPPA